MEEVVEELEEDLEEVDQQQPQAQGAIRCGRPARARNCGLRDVQWLMGLAAQFVVSPGDFDAFGENPGAFAEKPAEFGWARETSHLVDQAARHGPRRSRNKTRCILG